MSRVLTVEVAARAPGILSETVKIITAGETLSLPVSARVVGPGAGQGAGAQEDVAAMVRPSPGVREVFA
jgi:hypothetical protein